VKLEHIAVNVADPPAVAAWYRRHLGLEIVKSSAAAPYTQFLRDSSGAVMIEIYNHPPDQVPAYSQMDPMLLHLAFVSPDPEAKKSELLAAGAEFVSEQHLDDGSHLVMMRDPWGLALQLCRRAAPMLRPTD
jgi:catechol 2,3-dioxygenase-like lactoylglutathione lyase family enzyme